MECTPPALPGGSAKRLHPTGVQAGAPLTRIHGPEDALRLVAPDLAAAEQRLHSLLRNDVGAIQTIAGYLSDAGGKRLRPALTALGCRAVGVTPTPGLLCVGELVHLGSLLHDDVVDGAITRRGQPSSNQAYGNAVSVLTGDFCLARSILLAAEEGGHRAVTALGHAITAMAEGEVLQLMRAGDLSCPLDDYYSLIEKKSAALIAWCTAAGAYQTDQEAQATALAAYGRRVGIAFQITDDVLDYQAGTGKHPGADLRERKVTLPLMLAMQVEPSLYERLESPTAEDDLPDLIHTVRSTGALDESLKIAHRLVDEAAADLQVLPNSEARVALAVLGRFLVERVT